MTDQPAKRGASELDALIREAEMTVVESDRRWQHDVQALGPALRESTAKAAWAGAIGLGAIAIGWLVVRRLTRGRIDGAVDNLAGHRRSPPIRSPKRHEPVPPFRATGWRRITEFGGALVGSALRSGLAPANGKTGVSLLLSAGLPWLTRWWRSRSEARPAPRSGFRRPPPSAATGRSDRSAPRA